MTDTSRGLLAMTLACTIWGLSPLFFKHISHVPALEVLAHRAVWSLVFFAGLLAVQRRLSEVAHALTAPRVLATLLLAAMTISCNWFLFVWAIQVGRATESSLGYYIYPLFAVVLGRFVFAERLSRVQVAAVVLAAVAVGVLTYGLGAAPLIALALATTFSLYGVIKKRLNMGPVLSVTCEVAIIFPFALVVLLQSYHMAGGAHIPDGPTIGFLMLSGPITALPLILFSYAARRLRMSTMGLMQYLNPTLQFGCAVFVFSEPFGPWHLGAFTLIWTALALYSVSAVRQDKARRRAATAASVSGTAVM